MSIRNDARGLSLLGQQISGDRCLELYARSLNWATSGVQHEWALRQELEKVSREKSRNIEQLLARLNQTESINSDLRQMVEREQEVACLQEQELERCHTLIQELHATIGAKDEIIVQTQRIVQLGGPEACNLACEVGSDDQGGAQGVNQHGELQDGSRVDILKPDAGSNDVKTDRKGRKRRPAPLNLI